MRRAASLTLLAWLALFGLAGGQTREEKVRADRKKVEAEGFWIYNDLAKGFAEAKKTGKPMLVVLRCIPCVECVKLDDDLVNQDRRVRPLLEQMVCVRIISTNGLDLSLFQYDHDQSFAAFLLNADGVIYGRFGTRSHRTYWSDDVSIEGLAQALQGALALHREYPKNKQALSAKKGPPPRFTSPEKYPLLKEKYTEKLNYAGNVAQSCIHCHQIGDAERQYHRALKKPMPEKVLFSYPHPKTVGLILDPKTRATVLRAEKGSPAEQAGLEKGDVILSLEGQPLLSIADVQWVLHNTSGDGATLKALVERGDHRKEVALELPKGWKRQEDLSWRASSWGLRRMGTGGMKLEDLPEEERKKADIPATSMALLVKHVGQYGPHAAAKRAGFVAGDILISFDGRTDLLRETDLLAHAMTEHKPGDMVEVTFLRRGKKMTRMLPMQE